MPKVMFHGVNVPLYKALRDGNRTKALTRGKKLARDIEDAGFPEAATLLRARIETVVKLRTDPARSGGSAELKAEIDSIMQGVRGLVPRALWVGVNARLHSAWGEPDHERALKLLEREARQLDDAGYPKSASSLREEIQDTVTVIRLGIRDRDLRATLQSNNPIESLNRSIRKVTRRHHTRWNPPPSDMRRRWAAASIEYASRGFKKIERPERLRAVSFNVLKARHSDVELDISLSSSGLAISSIGVPSEARGHGKADAALSDLLKWANRRGLTVGVSPRALEAGVDEKRLNTWFASYGFEPNVEQRVLTGATLVRSPGPEVERAAPAVTAEIEESSRWAADPLDPYRRRIGELFGARIGARAIALGPEVAAQSDDELLRRRGVVREQLDRSPVLRDRVSNWLEAHGEAAARVVALARERARRGGAGIDDQAVPTPLDRYRGLLGAPPVQAIEARASELEAALDGRDEALLQSWHDRLGDPFEPLTAQAKAWMTDKAELVAAHVAIEREMSAREEMTKAAELAAKAPSPSLEQLGLSDRLAEASKFLGKEREQLLREHAVAFVGLLDRADTGFLVAWRARLGDPFAALDREGALQTLRIERDQRVATAERDSNADHAERLHGRAGTVGGRHQGRVRRQLTDEATASRSTAQRASEHLEELARMSRQLRDDGRHLDTWMSTDGDRAARVAAVDFELTVRRELDRALRAEQPLSQEQEAGARGVEPRPGEVAVEIEPIDQAGLGR